MVSNSRNTVPLDMSFGSRDLEMAAFDQLPAALRSLVREAPFNICASELVRTAASGVSWAIIGHVIGRDVQQFLALPREQAGWPSGS